MLDGVSLDQLRTFIAAVDEGSFSAAARKLKRVQSAVSGWVGSLEDQIGVVLFDRSGRFPKLTTAESSDQLKTSTARGATLTVQKAPSQLNAFVSPTSRSGRLVSSVASAPLMEAPRKRAQAPACRRIRGCLSLCHLERSWQKQNDLERPRDPRGGFDFPPGEADHQNPVALRNEFDGLWERSFHFGSLLKQIRQCQAPPVRAGQRPVFGWGDPFNIFGTQCLQTLSIARADRSKELLHDLDILSWVHGNLSTSNTSVRVRSDPHDCRAATSVP